MSQAEVTTTVDEEHNVDPAPGDSLDDKQPRPSPQNIKVSDMGKDRRPKLQPLHRIRSGRVNRQKRGYTRAGEG